MKTPIDWAEVFEVLDPPPGGLDRLRSRLDAVGLLRAPTPSIRRLRWAAAATASLAALLLATMAPWPARDSTTRERIAADANPALVRLGVAEEPIDAVTVPPGERHRTAVERVELARPGVIYYRVTVLDGQEVTSSHRGDRAMIAPG